MVRVFGGSDCRDSGRARRWLELRGLRYQYHDFHTHGIDLPTLNSWNDTFGWQTLIDRRTVAWRSQPTALKGAVPADEALAWILLTPQMLKSPIISIGDCWLLGWSAASKVRLLGALPSLSPGHEQIAPPADYFA